MNNNNYENPVKEQEKPLKASWLAPVSIEVFGGVINPEKLHFPFNHMQAGDTRDWTAIHTWSNKLVALLRPEPAGQVADNLASIR
ncbi:MAG TPA: hypothetical protein VNE38_19805 [Ktedonobacteraceae bacterium]|nr:hypothetical protein [Ktedonobacteraceae bacterium]